MHGVRAMLTGAVVRGWGTPTPVNIARTPGTAHRVRTGLWAQGGSQGPGRGRFAAASRQLFSYLRPFSPGQPNPAKPGSANDWIGSRSKPALGRLAGPGPRRIVIRVRKPPIRPGRDGTGTGRDGDGRTDGTDAWGRLIERSGERCSLLHRTTRWVAGTRNRLKPVPAAIQHYLVQRILGRSRGYSGYNRCLGTDYTLSYTTPVQDATGRTERDGTGRTGRDGRTEQSHQVLY